MKEANADAANSDSCGSLTAGAYTAKPVTDYVPSALTL